MNEQFIDEFAEAARDAAVLELQTRLLADKVSSLRHLSLDDLGVVEEALLEHFDGVISAEDARVLRDCTLVRNQLLHIQSWPAVAGAARGASAPTCASCATRHARTLPGALAPFASGPLGGRLSAFGRSGSYVNAGHLFRSGLAIIRRLLHGPEPRVRLDH